MAPQGYIALNPTFVSSLIDKGVQFDVRNTQQSREGAYGALVLGVLLFIGIGLTLYRVRDRPCPKPRESADDRPTGRDSDVQRRRWR